MARRHNIYSQLLDSGAHPADVASEANASSMPMTNAPDFQQIADDLRFKADGINSIADQLDACGQMQPDFKDLADGLNNGSGNGAGDMGDMEMM